jgi:hypothetical protein
MRCRIVPVAQGVVLSAAALLLMAPQVLAGVVHTGSQSTPRPTPAPAPAARPLPPPVTISVAVTVPGAAAPQAAYLSLRGPDGQVRRFAVEGGAQALPSRVVILRPGESLTIPLAARK